MSKRRSSLLVAALMTSCLAPQVLAQAKRSTGVKKTMAVAPIESTVAHPISWITPEALHAQMITELVKGGKYRIVERENLSGILGEQDLATRGRTRGGSSPKTGEIEGAMLMIKCVITGAEEKASTDKGGSLFGVSSDKKSKTYKVSMDVRVYDTETSMIVDTMAVSVEQVKQQKSGGINIGPIRFKDKESSGDTTGDVTRELIQKALAAIDTQAAKVPWRSKIVVAKEDKIIMRGGTRDGLTVGMRFKVVELGEKIIDDETGEVLDEGEETEVGTIQLSKVKEKVAYATLVTGNPPAKGNRVVFSAR